MAGDWIKMRMDLQEDPAVYKISTLTKLDRLSVVGRLYAFWTWADKHAVDGRVDGASSIVVDDIVRHSGFADAMVSVGWLEAGDEHISIPKHDRHNGESAKERSMKNARQARWREGKDKQVDIEPSTKTSTRPSTGASTREEKRREEKNKEPKNIAPPAGDAELFPDVDPQVIADFKALRKKKKAEITPTAMQGISREATRAGITLEAALRICCSRGWQGFNADWVERRTAPRAQQTVGQAGQANMQILKDRLNGTRHESDIIDIN